jgi:hypothetical protein
MARRRRILVGMLSSHRFKAGLTVYFWLAMKKLHRRHPQKPFLALSFVILEPIFMNRKPNQAACTKSQIF